jgi:hypothetical protein
LLCLVVAVVLAFTATWRRVQAADRVARVALNNGQTQHFLLVPIPSLLAQVAQVEMLVAATQEQVVMAARHLLVLIPQPVVVLVVLPPMVLVVVPVVAVAHLWVVLVAPSVVALESRVKVLTDQTAAQSMTVPMHQVAQ